jgi:hypothetical protein
MSNVTIIDFSAVLHASLHGLFKDKADWVLDPETNKKHVPINVLRQGLLGSLLYYKNLKHKADTTIIALDAPPYWRKDVLSFYKGLRKKSRNESDIDWKAQFALVDQLIQEFRETLPWHFISIPSLEADDVIGILAPRLAVNDQVIIISADGDLVQLQKYKNIRQWSPITKKFVEPKEDAITDLYAKVMRGDAGDGVPNVFSDMSIFEDRSNGIQIRQKPVSAKMITEGVRLGWDPYKMFTNETLIANFQRNQILVDFDFIPKPLVQECIDTYESTKLTKVNAMNLQMYLGKHRLKQLLDSVNEF